MKYIVAYLATAGVFLICDIVWLGHVARGFYRAQFGPLMADSIQIMPAIAFYLIYVLGVVIFVVAYAMTTGRLVDAALYGFLFGLVAYATFDLTSLAVIKGFPAKMAIVDMVWGGLVTAFSSVVAVFVVQKVF